MVLALLPVLAGLALARSQAPQAPPRAAPLGLATPEDVPGTDDDRLADLGARLFFDARLSSDGSVACASCHRPERAFADELPFSRGVRDQRTLRNTPTLLNRAFGKSFMWDGRAASLEEQALLPIENPLEMDLPLDQALERLRKDADLEGAFERATGAVPDRDGLARALAAYVRRLVRGDSPVDRFRAGDFSALSDPERAGLWFYESRGGCWRCHGGPNFTDEDFHATGVGVVDGKPEPGRSAITHADEDLGRFKTPTLRGVALTAPYMHDGSLATLADVVAFYRRGGTPNEHLDPLVHPIEMTDADATNLVAFLEALSR